MRVEDNVRSALTFWGEVDQYCASRLEAIERLCPKPECSLYPQVDWSRPSLSKTNTYGDPTGNAVARPDIRDDPRKLRIVSTLEGEVRAARELQDSVNALIGGLPMEQRQVIDLWYRCRQQPADIAKAMGLRSKDVQRLEGEAVRELAREWEG